VAGDILALKPGHDGTICAVRDGRLLFSDEAEKGSYPRHAPITASGVIEALSRLDAVPDVIALGGWLARGQSGYQAPGAGYLGIDPAGITDTKIRFLGKEVRLFSSSHERSHILCAYGLSPFETGRPVYVLVWEGAIGAFYEVNERLEIAKIGDVMGHPGNRYTFLFALANPNPSSVFDLAAAGKLMALAAFSSRSGMSDDERRTARALLDEYNAADPRKAALAWSHLHNVGVESEAFKEFAGKFSDALFDRFFQFARTRLQRGRPLLIVGGCGLNCEWNTRWADCRLFSDVFVPPCANDAGSAIGTAVDAQAYYWKKWKVEWSAYGGPAFKHDVELATLPDFDRRPFDATALAAELEAGKIYAFVQGRCEIGPRALGNRSLLAEPFSSDMHRRLNRIKEREGYRPIAPVCLAEQASAWFEGPLPSPHMLYFHRVKSPRLRAVTHVDGTARAQTIAARDNPRLHQLLTAFNQLTGFGVLCNTSLNFSGRGFINSTSDLLAFVRDKGLDGAVLEDVVLTRRPT
jgi:predicted NodU family carbamoyl transferase